MKRLAIPPLVAALTLLAAALSGPGSAAKRPVTLLPDPAQSPPRLLQVEEVPTEGGVRWRLGFLSAVLNAGRGPLIVHGHRPDTDTPEMTGDQLIRRSDGSTATVKGVGRLRFVESVTHNHWHLLGFERYELRRTSDAKIIAPAEKTGFCLTDSSHDAGDTPLPGEREQPTYTQQCGLNGRDLLQVTEGISIGWMDIYDPLKEGQWVDISRVPAGRYLLVHRVNVDGKLRELKRSNDASSLLIRISWPKGHSSEPKVDTLRSCFYSIRCYTSPPALGKAAAASGALRIAAETTATTPRRAKPHCRSAGRLTRVCSLSWAAKTSVWSAKLRITSTLDAGVPRLRYSGWVMRKPKHCGGRCGPVRKRVRGTARG
jgi:hypothetical protein